MKKIFNSVIAFSVICFNVTAQESKKEEFKVDKSPYNYSLEKVLIKSSEELKGDKYAFSFSYDKAIDSYIQSKQLSIDGQRSLAESYHNMDQNIQSEEAYLKLMNEPLGLLPEDYYNYAMVLKTNGKYDEARKWLNIFKELKPDDLRAKSYVADKDELSDLLKDDGKYKIAHLNINTDAEDFGTTYYKNKIVFTSSRANFKMIKREDNWSKKPYLDIYVSEEDGSQLKKPEIFDRSLNGKMNDGPASFSSDGTFMAFTRNNYHDKSKDRIVELQIYFRSFKDGKWTSPDPFVFNNIEYSVGHPCLTSDGNIMYFTSDMPGGFGKADIYRVTKDENGAWGKPENLGENINTEGEETFPFFEGKNCILFFTSNGRYGLGGLDIFISAKEGSGFGSAVNAGYPLNTQYDDFSVVVNEKMSKGYFSSNRSGGNGSDDIYSFDILKDLKTGKKLKIDSSSFQANSKLFNFDVMFSVNSPKNIPIERRVRETFPIRNYIFFDLGSTSIPDRYVLLKKDQVKEFKEEQLEVFIPKNFSGRSERQMVAYYNILNILGDRLGKNPLTSIILVGSSEKGPEDGKIMAESVKQYLVKIFGIKASRITIEGRDKPKIPSEHPGFTKELDLLREGDRRVSIESSSPALLMEFQSGPDALLKPVELPTLQTAPLDSYVSFKIEEGNEIVSSWSLEIMDDKGNVKTFGPYTQKKVSIPGKSILETRPEGNYKVTMISQTISGKTVKKDTTVHMVLWAKPAREEGLRFSIIYEFNDSKAIAIYEKYLTDVVIPKIPINGTVILSGYTDIVGEVVHNQNLSFARANDVRDIFEKGLLKINRNDVKFEVFGFGEDQNLSKFDNKYPEERFYNRTVVIDIIPKE